MHIRFRTNLKVLAAAVSLGLASTAFAATGTNSVSVAKATPTSNSVQIMGQMSDSQQLDIQVALELRNRGQLHSFIENSRSPSALIDERSMSTQEFHQQYSPTESQVQEVVKYLKSQGFRNIEVSDNRTLISAQGSSAAAQTAFSTNLAQVQTADGTVGYMNTSDASVPSNLQDTVLSVIGLQNVHHAHTVTHMDESGQVQPQAQTGHYPTEWDDIYGGDNLPSASDVDVGILSEGDLTATLSDLDQFTSSNNLPDVTTTVVNINGTSNDTSGTGEWDLDSQDIVGMAGGEVGSLVFYNMKSLQNTQLVDAINRVVDDNDVKIINVSLGECETAAKSDGTYAAADQAFAQAEAQGQTFSVSTGDSGADECGDGGTKASWPANSPHVIAVTGTNVETSGSSWTGETVWSSSGGSESSYAEKPDWQDGVYNGQYRGVADVAYPGDPQTGAKVIVNGRTQQIGGTSLSAPMFAGFWARVLSEHGTDIGFAGPLLYDLPQSDFHDITQGNNGGSQASSGYDLASGRGSIIMDDAMADLGSGGGNPGPGNNPPSADFSFTANGLDVSFTDTSSDSDGSVTDYSWDFGDGASSTLANPQHSYAQDGTYTVTLQVTDDDGDTDSISQNVDVSSSGNGGDNGSFQNGTDTPIPDGGSTYSAINVTGEPGSAPADMQVHVSIKHPYKGDLRVTLYAPNGASVVLKQPSYFSSGRNFDKTYTVDATAVQGNGTWELKVDDVYYGYSGYIDSWSLDF